MIPDEDDLNLESDMLDDNFDGYFDDFQHVDELDKNERFILNLLSKDGDIDDIIVGLDRIKVYIKKLQ